MEDARAQRAHLSHSLLVECLERFSSLCSVLRELNGIRPLHSAQWGNNSRAKLVCRGCVSIVFVKPYVEFECMFKNRPGRDVVQSNFHVNIASCPRNPRKCENRDRRKPVRFPARPKSEFALTQSKVRRSFRMWTAGPPGVSVARMECPWGRSCGPCRR